MLVYRPSLNAHFFRTPHLVAIGYSLFTILVVAFLWFEMARRNKQRAALRARRDGGEGAEKRTREEIAQDRRLGDKSVDYVYQI